jgi:DNA repair exonuclease SbcCD ATPase subunit
MDTAHTYESIMALIAETNKTLANNAFQIERSRQDFEDYKKSLAEEARKREEEARKREEEARKREEEARKREEEARKREEEARKRQEEETRIWQEESRKREEELQESRKALDRDLRNLAKQVGGITDTLGKFAQEQVHPRLVEMFRKRGVFMEEIHHNIVVQRDGLDYLEIDLLLVNTVYSVVVEVKNTLTPKDIDEHIERLEKLQKSPSRSIKGTKMYGAVAAMIMSHEVERYAIKKGFFVVKPNGDSVEISNAPSFKPKTWAVEA